MIDFLSSWAKGLGLAIVIVSILEMLLPNNKTKKYIRVVMGVYIIFSIISPFMQNKELISLESINIEKYSQAQKTTNENLNQKSMDERIEELYIEELEKDITKKINEKGYKVTKCKVDAKISDKEETKINKIEINIIKQENEKNEQKETEENIENKIVTEIQKIKTIDTTIKKDNNIENKSNKEKEETKITKTDIQSIKNFLIDEYGVDEKCLKIN